jgi:iron(III) transport system substrate-binding protein
MSIRPQSLLFVIALQMGCGGPETRSVVVYTSVDQVFAEPLLGEFTSQTGIQARAVFDIEATKTVGLANRLVAERTRPQADVFWNNEFMQTILLVRQGVLAPSSPPNGRKLAAEWRDPEGYWYASGARVRVFLTAPGVPAPASLDAISTGAWRGRRFAMAMPLFGTSATHAAALTASSGEAEAVALYGRLAKGARVVDGNSVVRDLVVDGSAESGLTDSDDACGAIERGSKAKITTLSGPEALLIPGTVALVRGAPHPTEAAVLMDWLLNPETERRLVEAGAAQVLLHGGVQAGGCLKGLAISSNSVPLSQIAAAADTSRKSVARLFSR